VRRACRFFLEVNGWNTAIRLKDRDAIVFPADAVGSWNEKAVDCREESTHGR
jgi:hypothetical protein